MFENVYVLSMPFIFILFFLEAIYCLITRNDYYKFNDTVANIYTAIFNQCLNLAVLSFAYFFYDYIQTNYGFFQIESNISNFLIALLLIDFLFYWFHRLGHTYTFLWASHSSHHSTKEMNYSVALRTSLTQRFASIFFYWPLALIGFKAQLMVPVISLNLVLQFWQHTRVIKRLPRFFEAIFNSPTHHRVHHGINDKYLDKNYAGILIIWDKIFGTYAKEEEPVKYGTLRDVNSYNINDIYFQYWKLFFGKLNHLKGIKAKLKYLISPLSQTSYDYPVKLGSSLNPPKTASVIVMLISLVLMYLIVDKNSSFSIIQKISYSLLLWLFLSNWEFLLEKLKNKKEQTI